MLNNTPIGFSQPAASPKFAGSPIFVRQLGEKREYNTPIGILAQEARNCSSLSSIPGVLFSPIKTYFVAGFNSLRAIVGLSPKDPQAYYTAEGMFIKDLYRVRSFGDAARAVTNLVLSPFKALINTFRVMVKGTPTVPCTDSCKAE